MGAVTSTTSVTCECPRCGGHATATTTREADAADQAQRQRVAVQCPNGCELTRSELAAVVRTLT